MFYMLIYVNVFVHYETHFLKLFDMLSNIYHKNSNVIIWKKNQIVKLFFYRDSSWLCTNLSNLNSVIKK
jgi:hypothetical protein